MKKIAETFKPEGGGYTIRYVAPELVIKDKDNKCHKVIQKIIFFFLSTVI